MASDFALRRRSTTRRLAPLVLGAALAGLGLACGGNVVVDHGGAGAGEGGGGGSASTSSSTLGTPQFACFLSVGVQVCEQIFGASASDVAGFQAGCLQTGGKQVPSCSAAGLVGCCVVGVGSGKAEECFYSGLSVSEVQIACQSQGGTFTTSP